MKVAVALIIIVILFFTSFPLYVKWHLSKYEGGAFYTLLNLISAPDDYYESLVDKAVPVGQEEHVHLDHKYAGKYILKVIAERDISVSSSLNCSGGFMSFSTNEESFYVEEYSEHWLLLYSVPSQVPFESDCALTFTRDFLREVNVNIAKFTHE